MRMTGRKRKIIKMTLDEFKKSLTANEPQPGLDLPLQALWWEGKGEWHKAHELCQQAGSHEGDRIHAYLHRVEGDDGNAGYWYARAGEPVFSGTLKEEWAHLVERYLK